jgi:hypothetical protein
MLKITTMTCKITHWLGWTPAAYYHGCRRRCYSCRDGAYDPLRHQQHFHTAGAFLMSRWASGLAWPLCAAAQGDVGYLTAQHSAPSPASLTPLHTVHALMIPGGQASINRGIPQPIWYHRSGLPTLMGWEVGAPSWCAIIACSFLMGRLGELSVLKQHLQCKQYKKLMD